MFKLNVKIIRIKNWWSYWFKTGTS